MIQDHLLHIILAREFAFARILELVTLGRRQNKNANS